MNVVMHKFGRLHRIHKIINAGKISIDIIMEIHLIHIRFGG